jgi:pimeloyl-ACP methyl ester carboxylesterase
MANRFVRSDEEFFSAGTRCAAWLYRPEGAVQPGIIIMGHGFAAERSFGLPRFAERFAAHGWAVWVFDYRSFGDSDGTPRNDVNPFKHGEDWDAAIAAVRCLPDINHARIVLWGTSFGGGHVTCAATRHQDIAAIIAQVPYTGIPESAPKPPLMTQLGLGLHILWDRIKRAISGKPHYIKVIGKPGTLAAMSTDESFDGYMALVPEHADFANQVPAGIFAQMGAYNPTALAHRVNCPALVIAAEQDSLINVEWVRTMADCMPRGQCKLLNCNHFAPYVGEMFEQNIGLQLAFLDQLA